jgi:hypothetical protein
MEAKVKGLITSMNEIKELLLMTKGGLGGSLVSRMFIANTIERSQMVPNWTNSLKEITLI